MFIITKCVELCFFCFLICLILYIQNAHYYYSSATGADEFGNCSQVFAIMDTNNNNYVGLHEAIIALAVSLNVWEFQSNVD